MISGSSSAQTPWPRQAIGLTRSWWLMSSPVFFHVSRNREQRRVAHTVTRSALVVPACVRDEAAHRAAHQLSSPVGVPAGSPALDQGKERRDGVDRPPP